MTRALLTAQALIIALIPASAPASIHPSFAVLVVYAVYAWAMLITLHVGPYRGTVHPVAAHAIDIVAATTMIWGAQDNQIPSLLLVLFSLVAAAYRWGMVGTVATAVGVALLLAAESVLVTSVIGATLTQHDAPDEGLLVRSVPLLFGGLLFGHLHHSERRMRDAGAAASAILARTDLRAGLQRTMAQVFDGVLELCVAHRLVVVGQESDSYRPFSWKAARAVNGARPEAQLSHPTPSDQPVCSSPSHAAVAWQATRTAGWRGGRYDVVAVDANGNRVQAGPVLTDALCSAIGPFDSVIAVDIATGTDWTGWLFLINPAVGSDRIAGLQFVRALLGRLAPIVQHVYAVGRLRSEARRQERARIAREMHDGVMQGVIGVEMQVAALRRRFATDAPHVVGELTRLNDILRQEAIGLRELMQEMKPVDVDPEQVLDRLADDVQRFQRETGIAARFVTQLDRLPLSPSSCREVVRIVNEALVNVRRHSGARNVYVRLSADDGDCRLSVEDDGRGFPFAGRVTHAERGGPSKGPAVIGERVRLLGGHLTVESDPGRGARLDVAVPLSGVA